MRFATAAMINIPNMYASELFPMQSRSIAAGVSIGISCSYLFISIKTFYNLEYWLNMSITFCIYGGIGIIGYDCISFTFLSVAFTCRSLNWSLRLCCRLCVCYRILPLTEGLSLEEVEKHYSDSRKKVTDWKISPSTEESTKTWKLHEILTLSICHNNVSLEK